MPDLDLIYSQEGFRLIFDLLEIFSFAAYFEQVFPVEHKVALFWHQRVQRYKKTLESANLFQKNFQKVIFTPKINY